MVTIEPVWCFLMSIVLIFFEDAKLTRIQRSIARPYVVSMTPGDTLAVTAEVTSMSRGAGI